MSKLDSRADSVIAYCEKRAKKGYYEVRRDWLYGPAQIAPGTYNQDGILDEVIRRVKDRGALRTPQFEFVYVYARPPVWTFDPTDWIRDRAHIESFKRARSEQARWQQIAPHNPAIIGNASLASGVMLANTHAISTLDGRSPEEEPMNDPVLQRIDAMGIAN